jgi:hypothetical protein
MERGLGGEVSERSRAYPELRLHTLQQQYDQHYDDCVKRKDMTDSDVQILNQIEAQMDEVNARITEKYKQIPSG